MPSSVSTSWQGALHDLGARIVILVDAVAEAIKRNGSFLSLARAMYSGM